jgi:hypothetical protein
MGLFLRRTAIAALVVVLVAAFATWEMTRRGREALAASDVAFDQGRLDAAIALARAAAVAYVPGAPHVEGAYERLAAVALGAEAAGHPEVARAAWEAIRGATLETRHLWQPHPAHRDRASENLARLLVKGDSDDPRRGRRAMEGLYNAEPGPAPLRGALLVMGFLGTILGLAAFIARGVGVEGRLEPRRAWLAFAVILLGVACFTGALYKA